MKLAVNECFLREIDRELMLMWFRNSFIVGVFVKVKLYVNCLLCTVCRAGGCTGVYYVGFSTDNSKHIYVLYIIIKTM